MQCCSKICIMALDSFIYRSKPLGSRKMGVQLVGIIMSTDCNSGTHLQDFKHFLINSSKKWLYIILLLFGGSISILFFFFSSSVEFHILTLFTTIGSHYWADSSFHFWKWEDKVYLPWRWERRCMPEHEAWRERLCDAQKEFSVMGSNFRGPYAYQGRSSWLE